MSDKENLPLEEANTTPNQEPEDQEPEELCYDLDLLEIPIAMRDKKKGITKHFILREPNGATREKILNKLNSRSRASGTGVRDFSGLHAEVICLAMFEGNKPITAAEVNSWPGRVQDDMFKKVLKYAGLDKEAEQSAKND